MGIFLKDQQRVEGANDSTRKKKQLISLWLYNYSIIIKKSLHKK